MAQAHDPSSSGGQPKWESFEASGGQLPNLHTALASTPALPQKWDEKESEKRTKSKSFWERHEKMKSWQNDAQEGGGEGTTRERVRTAGVFW